MSLSQDVDTPPSPQPSHSPSSASHSLAAAAALNAGLHNEEASRRSSNGSGVFRANSNSMQHTPSAARRRSSIRMNLNIHDPTIPGPGEMQMSPGGLSRMHTHSGTWPASPTHNRQPSLGELHQELENEQEAQVNRLLALIRQQQAQIASFQSTSAATLTGNNSAVVDDSTPTSERSLSLTASAAQSTQNLPSAQPVSSISAPRSRSPFHPTSLSRHSSYRRSTSSSRNASPNIQPMSSSTAAATTAGENGELLLGASATTRDEASFYQAETQMLTRENQMLKLRIRELERQLNEMNPTSPITHSPATASGMNRPPINRGEGEGGGEGAGPAGGA